MLIMMSLNRIYLKGSEEMCYPLRSCLGNNLALAMPERTKVRSTVEVNGLISYAASLIVPCARIAGCCMKASKSKGGDKNNANSSDTRSRNRHKQEESGCMSEAFQGTGEICC